MVKMIQLACSIDSDVDRWSATKKLSEAGAVKTMVLTREIVVEVPAEALDAMREAMRKLGAAEIKIKEMNRIENTISRSGHGVDPEKSLEIRLMPATRATGLKLLDITLGGAKFDKMEKEELKKISSRYMDLVTATLENAGITDVLFAMSVLRPPKDERMSMTLAVIDAIYNCDGAVQIEHL